MILKINDPGKIIQPIKEISYNSLQFGSNVIFKNKYIMLLM